MKRYNSDDSYHSSQSHSSQNSYLPSQLAYNQPPVDSIFYAPPTRPLTNFDPRNLSQTQNQNHIRRQGPPPILQINPNLITPPKAVFSTNTSPSSYHAPDTPRAMEFGDAASIRNGREPSGNGSRKAHCRTDTQAVFNRFSIMVKKDASTSEKDHQSEWLKNSNNAGSKWMWGGWIAAFLIICSVTGVLLWLFLYFKPHQQHHSAPKQVVSSLANSTVVKKVAKRAVDFGLHTLKH